MTTETTTQTPPHALFKRWSELRPSLHRYNKEELVHEFKHGGRWFSMDDLIKQGYAEKLPFYIRLTETAYLERDAQILGLIAQYRESVENSHHMSTYTSATQEWGLSLLDRLKADIQR